MATLVRVALSISLAVSVAAVFLIVVSVVLFFAVNIRGGVFGVWCSMLGVGVGVGVRCP